MLLKVFNKNHPLYKTIVYDTEQREYYNISTDIYLSQDDISVWSLRPYHLIPIGSLPEPLPSEYFITWKPDTVTKITIVSTDYKFLVDLTKFIERYPKVEPESTTITYGEVDNSCKSSCPTPVSNSQSDVSTQTD